MTKMKEEDKEASAQPLLNEEQSQINLTVPDFSLKTMDGEDISLKNYREKKIVHLAFWTTWQPTCFEEIPRLKKLYQATRDYPFEILAIAVGINDSLENVRMVQERLQIPYKILFDEDGKVAQAYGVLGFPTHIVISKEGQALRQFNLLPENLYGFIAEFFSTPQ